MHQAVALTNDNLAEWDSDSDGKAQFMQAMSAMKLWHPHLSVVFYMLEDCIISV